MELLTNLLTNLDVNFIKNTVVSLVIFACIPVALFISLIAVWLIFLLILEQIILPILSIPANISCFFDFLVSKLHAKLAKIAASKK